jgi:hypothetical protein
MDDITPRVDGRLRVGDAERDRAAAALGEHFGAGRLDRDEFDARLAAALTARTEADLAVLFADLPGGAPSAPRPAPEWPSADPRPYLPFMIAPLLFLLTVVAVVHGHPPLFIIPLFWLFRAARRGRFRPWPR